MLGLFYCVSTHMAKRVDIAYYIGQQEMSHGQYSGLWNIIPKGGILDQKNRITYPADATVTQGTLLRIFPHIVFPANPKARTINNADDPVEPGSIAYAMF